MKKKEEKINVTFKGFWGKLFCKHNYLHIGNINIYSSVENKKADLPSSVYLRWVCTKCGKQKKIIKF